MAATDKSYMLIDGDGNSTACIPRHADGTTLAIMLIEKVRPVAQALGSRLHLHETRAGRDRTRVYRVDLHTTPISLPDDSIQGSFTEWHVFLNASSPIRILRRMFERADVVARKRRKEAAEAVNAAQDAERQLDTIAATIERMLHGRAPTDVERAAVESVHIPGVTVTADVPPVTS